jgi:glutamate dehydrogenase (NAD(P)+)
VSGGLYNPEGLDANQLNQHVTANPKHLLEGYGAPGVEHISNDDLLLTDVDVLIPAALEHQIRADNAPYIQASMVVEGANGPTTREGDEILHERGVIVVPDVLANAGGVIVSYLEWVQDLQNFFWEEAEVNRTLKNLMVRAFAEVWDFSRQKQVPLRKGALMLAVQRVAEAIQSRGIFP